MTTLRRLVALLARRVASSREAQQVSFNQTCDFVCALPIMLNGCNEWVDDRSGIGTAAFHWQLDGETMLNLLRILTRLPHVPACYAEVPAMGTILAKHYISSKAGEDDLEWAQLLATVAAELARGAEQRRTKVIIDIFDMLFNSVNIILRLHGKVSSGTTTVRAEGHIKSSIRLVSLLADRIPRSLVYVDEATSCDTVEERGSQLERAWCLKLEASSRDWNYVRLLRVITDGVTLEHVCRSERFPATFMRSERGHYIDVFVRVLQHMPLLCATEQLLAARPLNFREWRLIFKLVVSAEPRWRTFGQQCIETVLCFSPQHSPLHRNDSQTRLKIISALCGDLFFRARFGIIFPRLFVTVLPFFFADDGLTLYPDLCLITEATRSRLANICSRILVNLTNQFATQVSLTSSHLARIVVLVKFARDGRLQTKTLHSNSAAEAPSVYDASVPTSRRRPEVSRVDMSYCISCVCLCGLRSLRPGSWEALLPERHAHAAQTLRELVMLFVDIPQSAVEETAKLVVRLDDTVGCVFSFLFHLLVDPATPPTVRAEAVTLLCRVIDALAVIVSAPQFTKHSSTSQFTNLALRQLSSIVSTHTQGPGKNEKAWMPDPALQDLVCRSIERVVHNCLSQATVLLQQQDGVSEARGPSAPSDNAGPPRTTDAVELQRMTKMRSSTVYQYVLRSMQIIIYLGLHADKLPSEATMRQLLVGTINTIYHGVGEISGRVMIGLFLLVHVTSYLGYHAHSDVMAALTTAVRRQCKEGVLRGMSDDMLCNVFVLVNKIYYTIAPRFPYSKGCRGLGRLCLVFVTHAIQSRATQISRDKLDEEQQSEAETFYNMLPITIIGICSSAIASPIRGVPMDTYIEVMENYIRHNHPRPPVQHRPGLDAQLSHDELNSLETRMIRLIGNSRRISFAQAAALVGHDKLLQYNCFVYSALFEAQFLTIVLFKMPSELREARVRRYLDFYRMLCSIIPLKEDCLAPSVWYEMFMHARHFTSFFSARMTLDDILRRTLTQSVQHILSYAQCRQNCGTWLQDSSREHKTSATITSSPLLSGKSLITLPYSLNTAVDVDLRAYMLRLSLESLKEKHATLAGELREMEQLDCNVAATKEMRRTFTMLQSVTAKFVHVREW